MKSIKYHLIIIFHLVSFFTLIFLGSWQVYRLNWKTQIINKYKTNIVKPIRNFDNNFNIEQDEFLNISLKGTFDYTKTLFMFSNYNSNAEYKNKPGYYIFNIFHSNNKQILVNRGWVPVNYKENLSDINTPITKINGIVLKPPNKSIYTPASDFNNNIITNIDLDEVSHYFNIKLENFYIIQTNIPSILPLPKVVNADFHNFHLVYAIIWYSLAVTCLYFLKHILQNK